MADFSYVLEFAYSKSGTRLPFNSGKIDVALTGTGMASALLTVTESAALAIPLAGVTSPGLMVLENLDATNYIQLGYDDSGFVAVMRVRPGQLLIVSLIGLMEAPYAQANTANCLSRYTIVPQ